jgi:hypothetical protein
MGHSQTSNFPDAQVIAEDVSSGHSNAQDSSYSINGSIIIILFHYANSNYVFLSNDATRI